VRLSAPTRQRSEAPEPRRARRPSRTQRRFARRLRARRWRAWRRVLILVGVVAAVGGLGWLVFFSSLLAVHQVSVTGVEVLSEDEVRSQAAVPYDVPLATSDLDAVQARVEALAPVAAVEVSRDWPDGVHVAVTERQAVAAVPWEGAWRGVDSDGVLFRDYAEKPDLPLLEASASTPASALAEAAAVVEGLPTELVDRIETVDVGSIDDITLQLRGGAQVRWGSADEADRKEQVLALLMRQPAQVYDVTAPGRPTIKR
jgi:cell division protein FtsQ